MDAKEFRKYINTNTVGFKDNPNNFEIVKKWNRIVYNRIKYAMFDKINEIVNQYTWELMTQNLFKDVSNIDDIDIGEPFYKWYDRRFRWMQEPFENAVIKIRED